MNSKDVTIYHNPACGTSRNTLAMIRHAGIEPTVIEYLKHPPARDELRKLIANAGLTVRQALREKGTRLSRPSEVVLEILPAISAL